MAEMVRVALTIAGSDPSGGAGIQADLKTFQRFGVYGEAVITLLTVQNTTSVERVVPLDAELVAQQIQAVIGDIPPAAAKLGALGTPEIIEMVAKLAESFAFPLVIDPVMISKHGASLLAAGARNLVVEKLVPRAFLLTPNLPEAMALTGLEISGLRGMRAAAKKLVAAGARNVLIKGGHLELDATDLLLSNGAWFEFPSPRIATRQTHGTGCTYSAAITAGLALGLDLPAAIGQAKRFIHEAIRTAPGLGHGCGPVNHFAGL